MRSENLIMTATYNEIDSIGVFISKVREFHPNSDILIIDDSSPDGTRQFVESIMKDDPRIYLVNRPRKLGIGTAHLLAMQYALNEGYQGLVTMDADLSHDPAEISKIFSLLKINEFVTGSRYIEGGKCGYGFFRLNLSRLSNFLVRLVLNVPFKESTTSFRGFSRSLLEKLPLTKFSAIDYGFFPETIFWVMRTTKSYAEFPIDFKDRRFGKTKISKSSILKAAFKLLTLLVKRLSNTAISSNSSFLKLEKTSCKICQSEFHIELYPNTKTKESDIESKAVACSTLVHSSHGRIASCLSCGSVANNPMISSKELLPAYEEVIDETYMENIASREATFKHNFKNQSGFFPSQGKILDIGCYCGAFLKISSEMGYISKGVEPSSWASKKARAYSNCEVVNGTIDSLDPSERFDLITAFDVMEHLVDPLSEVAKVNKHLDVGGYFIFSTLDFENWAPQLLGEKWPWMMDMHLYYFSISTIEDILAKNGFKLVDVKPYSHIIPMKYFLIKLDAITGGKIISTVSRYFPSFITEKNIRFCLGDIKLFTCIKIDA